MARDTSELEDVDKKFLYSQYEDGERRRRERLGKGSWREKLAEKAAHKSLDIARDGDAEEMEINAPRQTTVNGLTARDLMAMAGIGGAIWVGSLFANKQPATKAEPSKPAMVDTDTVNRHRLEFAEPIPAE